MKYYEKMLSLGCFSFEDAVKMAGSEQSALTILNQYAKKGYVAKIRRGLYSAVNLYDHEPVANRFEIASSVSETAVVSHHSAFEYYGYTNQVAYTVTVTSDTRFNEFSFGGYRYVRRAPSLSSGVNKMGNHISVTDVERTVLDGIDGFESDMGFEELIQCIRAVPLLSEEKMIRYLSEYDKCFMYQKTGLIFEHYKNEFGISKEFLDLCSRNSGKSSRYLLKDMKNSELDFSGKWHLTIPKNLWKNVEGGNDNADV